MSVDDKQVLLSPGEIAARLGVPVHRVVYHVNKRNIREAYRVAGGFRLFDENAVIRIQDSIAAAKTRNDTAHRING